MSQEHNTQSSLSRRKFIGQAAATVFTLAIPGFVQGALASRKEKLTLGMITDLHQDIMHDAPARLDAFLSAMRKVKPDALVQLGDFAYPSEKNLPLINRFNDAHKVPLHVVGNHDTDSGFKLNQVIEVWKMPAAYYAKVVKGYRLIILNGNEKGSPTYTKGYPAYIGPEQTAWLRKELADSREPVIVISHQPLAGEASVDNAAEIQQILTDAKDKVVLAINGHTHVDAVHYIHEIPYLTINSASYFWVGGKYDHESYPKEIHTAHPYIRYTCPYSESLFTTLTIDPGKKTISVAARKGEWVGKSPDELGYNDQRPQRRMNPLSPLSGTAAYRQRSLAGVTTRLIFFS